MSNSYIQPVLWILKHTPPQQLCGGQSMRHAPIHGVTALARAGGVPGLRDEVGLHVVEEGIVVVLYPAGKADG